MGETTSGQEGKGKGKPILSTLMTSRKQKNHKMSGEKGISSLFLMSQMEKSDSEEGRVRARSPNYQIAVLSTLTQASKLQSQRGEGFMKESQVQAYHTQQLPSGEVYVYGHLELETSSLSLLNSPMSSVLLWVEGNFAVRVKGYLKANTQARTSSSSVLPSPLAAQVLRFIH